MVWLGFFYFKKYDQLYLFKLKSVMEIEIEFPIDNSLDW